MSAAGVAPDRTSRALLALAAVAVAFAAADTYVVVLALPDMMASAGLSADELQRAAPIVSGFLLGYVAVLPLIGRIADLRGRVPVLVGSLLVFALGSLVTAAAYDLPSMVTGRFLQGVGGGGLVPATLALVADLYPPHRARDCRSASSARCRSSAASSARCTAPWCSPSAPGGTIFWVNLAVGLVLAAVLRAPRAAQPADRVRRRVPSTRVAGPRSGSALLALVLARRAAGDDRARRPSSPTSTWGWASCRWSARAGGSPRSPWSRPGCSWRCSCCVCRRGTQPAARPAVVARRSPRGRRSRGAAAGARAGRGRARLRDRRPRGRGLLPRRPVAAARQRRGHRRVLAAQPRLAAHPLVPPGGAAPPRRPGARWWSASSSAAR